MEKAEEKLELITKYFADFSPQQLQQFLALDGLYKEWNRMINVISRKDEDSLYEKHVLHSLSIAATFDLQPGMQVLDLGTGGGFPGIPLAIFFPEVKFFLADSIGKKIKVVKAVADAIGLKNIEARQVRAEEIKDHRFDTVVSRAVAPLGELWKWSKMVLGKRQMAEGKGQMAQGRGHKAEGTRQKAEGRWQKAQGRGQMAEGKGQKGGIRGEKAKGLAGNNLVRYKNAQKRDQALPVPNGLICLKGGDLTDEIIQSGCKPRIMEVHEIFNEPVFKEKYILYVPSEK